MTQADSVHSTPPTNTSKIPPVDPTRRHLLSVAAGGAVAAAIPTAALMAVPAVDPIFAAIEKHRQTYAAMEAVFAEYKRAHCIADATVGPSHIMVPSMVEPGATVEASCSWDIEQAVPPDQYPDLYAHHGKLLNEQRAAHMAFMEAHMPDEDEATDEVCGPEHEALYEFAGTMPTTLPGLLAMVVYAGKCSEDNSDAFADRDCPLIEHLAMAVKALQVRS